MEMEKAAKRAFWMGVARKLGIGLIVILLLLWLRSKLRKIPKLPMLMEERRPRLPKVEEPEEVTPELEESISPEALKEARLQELVGEFVQREPDRAARLLRTWLTG